MSKISFADVVHQTMYFSKNIESEAIVLDLVDTNWFQRLRDIAQTGNTKLVYMFSEHSRFGHSLGVAYLACHLMNQLAQYSEKEAKEIEEYRTAVSAAALLHDIGHIAPGSHTAYKTWYPGAPDCHEEVSIKIIQEDPQIQAVLNKYGKDLSDKVCKILSESEDIPPWTWEVISGGGWNVDRGNWCIVDSVMAGVTYGRYNIPALIESMVITSDGHIALRENRLDAMVHFAIARHSMYRQVYHHRVLLSSETLNKAIVDRARHLGKDLKFTDQYSRQVLNSKNSLELPLDTIFAMRESWWNYHVLMWSKEEDTILRDLSDRLINRNLLKTIRIPKGEDSKQLFARARQAVSDAGFDPTYYLHHITTEDVHAGDLKSSMQVLLDDGRKESLGKCEPLWDYLTRESGQAEKAWLVLPEEAKKILGIER